MGEPHTDIHPDIRKATTLPADFYRSQAVHDRLLGEPFCESWQPVVDVSPPPGSGAYPFVLLPGSLDEPLLLTVDEKGAEHCLSNVCTHRGNLVVTEPGRTKGLRCSYHGRRFELTGRFRSMPEFEDVCGFPSGADDLPALSLERFGPLRFTSLKPNLSFDRYIAPVAERVGFLPLDALRADEEDRSDYDIQANWALYCDNYLEGFHIPFVHEALNEALDYGAYRTECFDHGSLQVGVARDGDDAFDLPASHPDHGQRVAAYYFWLFPNVMLNFYPWGLSLNVVLPQGVGRTRVSFRTFVSDATRRSRGAGGDLHRVELEDEAVVESVQRGIRSRLYRHGRYSPTQERGVHHFHRLLTNALRD